MSIKVLEEKCIGCGICVKACPFNAIDMTNTKAIINEKCTICGTCVEECPVDAIDKEIEKNGGKLDISSYKGVWVFAEVREGNLLNVAIELLGEGRRIADKLGVELTAVLLGHRVDDIARQLVGYGADRVLYVENQLLEVYTTDGYTKVITELIQNRKPEILLIGATTIGRDLGPRLSARIGTGLTADCTRLEVDEEDGKLLQTRPAFGGNLMATIVCPNHRPQMSTVRPGVMEKAKYDENNQGIVEKLDVTLSKDDMGRTYNSCGTTNP